MPSPLSLQNQPWTLEGWVPFLWRVKGGTEFPFTLAPEIGPIPAEIPGSVQLQLLKAGLILDWMKGFNFRSVEWIENRHWIYKTPVHLPPDYSEGATLRFESLDYKGWVLWDGHEIGTFDNGHLPHSFQIPSASMNPGAHELQVIFDFPPRWMGEFGMTSQMKELKARFNFSWDWAWRLVQVGFTGYVTLQPSSLPSFQSLRLRAACTADFQKGSLDFSWEEVGSGEWSIEVYNPHGALVARQKGHVTKSTTSGTVEIPIPDLWNPNGLGDPALYRVRLQRFNGSQETITEIERLIGFRTVTWNPCEGAPIEADPWICVINGKSLFLQGVNWTPIRPNTADVTANEYEKRILQYKSIGMNLLRVWGGASKEKNIFYELCDQHGLLVWQEMPLSSSTLENYPPDDEETITRFAEIARAYLLELSHHPSLIIWSGGNELQKGLDGRKEGFGLPCGLEHPMLRKFADIFSEEDPDRRFTPTSASGPREFACDESEWGKGLHWDVHGPWKIAGSIEAWKSYWNKDDSLIRTEAGCCGASSAEIIETYAAGEQTFPCDQRSPWWNHPTGHWIEWPQAVEALGREPKDLREYVAWSQQRQATGLEYAAQSTKSRFPKCGGFIIWMGHDSYPVASGSSILDYHGEMKPAAIALQKVFKPSIP